jgi:hypothetical protein
METGVKKRHGPGMLVNFAFARERAMLLIANMTLPLSSALRPNACAQAERRRMRPPARNVPARAKAALIAWIT